MRGLFSIFFLFNFIFSFGQSLPDSLKKRPIDVNFLFAYYEQDGNHSPVTGGIGTEFLTDKAMKTIVNVPLDSISDLNVSHHINRYSSASTDRINKKMSSASAKDFRTQLYIDYSQKNKAKHKSYGFFVGGSLESDYLSTSFGGKWTKSSKDDNREINLKLQIMLDRWLIIIPNELRLNENITIHTNRRNSYSLSLNYSQTLHKRLQASISSDFVYQSGLLSTPFHRVYFKDQILPSIENFPNQRIKIPIGFRLNYFWKDFFVFRNYYRFYFDSFNIQAHTYQIDTPIKLHNFFKIIPFYRYHTQSSAFFFAPYKEHILDTEFYTSDYDLSNISSQKIGIGLSYSPLYGFFRHRIKKRINMLKKIEVRYAQYYRSDGLESWIANIGLQFIIK